MAGLNACRDCDTVYAEVTLTRGQVARCSRCHAVIARHPHADVDQALAVALACAIVFCIANVTPVLGIEVAGTHTEANIWKAVLSMKTGWMSISALVLIITMFLVPLVQVSLVLWLMSFAKRGRRAPAFSRILVVLHTLRPWSMSEVFLLGALVAIVKLSNFLPISTGPGVWALAVLTLLLAVLGRFDPRSWWQLDTRSPGMMTFPAPVASTPVNARAAARGLAVCRLCGRVGSGASAGEGRCDRCHSIVTARMPHSSERTLAWLLAGIILYIPANLLPVMHTSSVRGDEDSTIVGGIVEFWRSGSWDIAILIFIASVAVPVTKFLSLGLLLWTVHRRSGWAPQERTRLYRFVEFIGYWSMLDVVVVAITCSLLKFNALATAEPRPGIVFFCCVVVATMVAAMSFDPRLIWDSPAGAS